jgi:hypothetical protein
MAFKDSFAAARKAGKKTFSFEGKSYNTKLAPSTPKKGPVPATKPSQESPKSGASRSTSGKASATSGASRSTADKVVKPKQDYPRPSRQTGIAKPGSAISKSVAKEENKPVPKDKPKATIVGKYDRKK